ncbi:unnamed protein product [Heterosigma akashiwo]
MKEYHVASGRNSVLPYHIELELVNFIERMFERAFPLDNRQLQLIALKIANTHGISDFQASNGRAYNFRQRHKDKLSLRSAQALERVRVGAANYDSIKTYFDLLQRTIPKVEALNGDELTAPDMFNQDEIGANQFTEKGSKVLAIKCSRREPRLQKSSDRTHFTASVFVCADGEMMDSSFVSKEYSRATSPCQAAQRALITATPTLLL